MRFHARLVKGRGGQTIGCGGGDSPLIGWLRGWDRDRRWNGR
jgi:hypothetical protein